jgi:Zn-dependent metalloprotease
MSHTRRLVNSVLCLFMILSMGLSLAQPKSAYAQEGDGLKRQLNAQSGKVSFIGPASGRSLSAARALGTSSFMRPADPARALAKRFAPEFGIQDPERDLSEIRSDRPGNGHVTVRYQQNYQGIPVMGAELIVNTNENGDLYSINGEVAAGISLQTQPTIDSEEARQTALRSIAKWYQKTSADFIATQPELWIFDESLLQPSTRPVELVWRMEVSSVDSSMPVRELVLINAQRGSISLHFNQIDTAWTLKGSPGSIQEPNPTPTPLPTGTPLPTEIPDPTVTPTPTEEIKSSEEVSIIDPSEGELTSLSGVTWYVATTGNDSSSCSAPASPCLTINGAIGKAGAGDTIKVAAGMYQGNGTDVVTASKNITLSGGWISAFTSQSGFSTIDGQNLRRGILVNNPLIVIIENLRILDGNSQYGGGISNGGTLTINKSIISNNSGGGIYHWGDSLTINDSTIINNTSNFSGGGIHSSGTLALNNSTVSGNSAVDRGGGIYGGNGFILRNSTITNNSASIGGGFEGRGTLQNTILYGNRAAIGPDCSPSDVRSAGYNIIGDCPVTAASGDRFHTDPLISTYPISSLGYHALKPGSPAIDAGNPATCLSTDQRGLTRPQGGACDIGAYEFILPGTPSSSGIANGSNQRIAPTFTSTISFAVYVIDNQGSPVSGIAVTFIAPGTGTSGVFANTGTNTTVAVTDSGGLAIASPFKANNQRGSYAVTATVTGLSGSETFAITNVAWYVSPTGNNSNGCNTPSLPCLSIDAALGKASSGDSVEVAAGTYAAVTISKSMNLSGGWDTGFGSQGGISIVAGGNTIDGIKVHGLDVTISKFVVQNSNYGINHTGGSLHFDRGALINNSSGIYNDDGDTTFTNTTISGNRGHGIIAIGGMVKIRYSTITNNATNGTTYGVVGHNGYTKIEIENSILAGNTANRDFCASNILSHGYNIFTSLSSFLCSYSTSITPQPSDKVGVDPRLFPLFPGGYHPPRPGSPIIDSADYTTCPITDQRNATRPAGAGCDIGSFEQRSSSLLPTYIFADQGTPQILLLQSLGSSNLVVLLLDGNGDTVTGKTVTFSAPTNGASGTFADTQTNVTTAATNSKGMAAASAFTANDVKGSYIIRATVNGLISSADFQLTNQIQQIKTYTAGRTSSLSGTLLCDQGAMNCTDGSDPQADKAHLYAIGTFNLYRSVHNRDGLDRNNMPIISTVHYCSPSFCPYANAFWNGTQIVYGDTYGYPLADDVVAHELTHGITQFESNLFYYYQSGAINESFSDLWGEYYDQTNGQGYDGGNFTWQIGEDVANAPIVRHMSDPPWDSDPDTMSSYWYYEGPDDNGGVHTNGGINNKAVFLMVQGGTFNGKTVSGLGWDKTIAIYYEVNTHLLSSGADYSDLYHALQQACSNLIGQKGITANDCTEVKNAIDAVEMYAQPAYNFSSDAPLCDVGTPNISFVDDLENGAGKWTFANGGTTRWQVDSPFGPYAQSAYHSLYADDYPASITDAQAWLSPITVPSNAYLHFAHAYDFEADMSYYYGYYYDGGVLEYSTNGGVSWLDAGPLMDFNAYPNVIYSNWNNPLRGRPAFVGSSHGFTSTRLNLASLAGKTVIFRWRMGLDDTGLAWGWWVDNVQVYSCAGVSDTTPPRVQSIKRTNSNPTSDPNVGFTVTFSEPVTGVNASDFAVTTTGLSNAVLIDFDGSGSTYQILIDRGSGDGTMRLDVIDNDTIKDSANNPLGGMGANNGNFTSGEVYTIVVPPKAATLVTPSGDNGTNYTPTYTWNKILNASWYYLWVSRVNGDGSLTTVHTKWYDSTAVCSGATCSITPAGISLGSGNYSWWIQTWNEGGYGPWSSRMDFSVGITPPPGAAILVSPNGGIADTTPDFTWNKVNASSWYYLWVSRINTDGSLTTIHTKWYDSSSVCSGTTCSITPAGATLTGGNYRWWIQTYDDAGGYGPWSTKMDFSLPVVTPPGGATLLSPSGSTTDTTPNYTWNKVNASTWYYLWVSKVNGDGSLTTVHSKWYDASLVCSSATCSITPAGVTLGSGSYRWWVQTWNDAGYGPWSAPTNFSTP